MKDQQLIDLVDKKHKCYVSSVCTLKTFNNEYVCSISADQIIVWRVSTGKLEEVMAIPLNFTQTGDYKWWEICELNWSQTVYEARIACCSSKDNETRIYKINLKDKTYTLVSKFKQKFHPRALA